MNDDQDSAAAQTDPVTRGQEIGLVWHPAIRALGWVKDWGRFALLLAVTWQLFTTGQIKSGTIGQTVAMSLAVAFALVMLIVVVFVIELWGSLAYHARRNYPSRFASLLVLVYSAIALLLIVPYLVLVGWLVSQLAGIFAGWGHFIEVGLISDDSSFTVPPMPVWAASGTLLLAAIFAYFLCKPTFFKALVACRLYGVRGFLRGMGLMVLLRCRQPRRDFFFQAPIVGQIHWFAGAALLYALMPPPFFSWAVPIAVVVIALAHGADHLLPPAWFFLGRSQADSFLTFDKLYHGWRMFGVTMLNRDSRAWHDYYFALAHQLARAGYWYASFMNRPRTPRVWSFRSRDVIWQQTAWQLMRFVKVVVIDVRSESYYIFDEVLWLAELQLVDKTWYVGNDDGSAPGMTSALDWGRTEGVLLDENVTNRMSARVITEQRLCASCWSATELNVPSAD